MDWTAALCPHKSVMLLAALFSGIGDLFTEFMIAKEVFSNTVPFRPKRGGRSDKCAPNLQGVLSAARNFVHLLVKIPFFS